MKDTAETIPTHWQLHEEAVARGEHYYIDPISKSLVTTELAHRLRGSCCKCNCRHCPYGYTNRGESAG